MKDTSIELLYLLLFAAIIVGQYLIQWFKRNKEKWQDDVQTESAQQAQDLEADDLPFLRTSAPAPEQHVWQPVPEITTHVSKSRRPAVSELVPTRTRKRYSREALFGSKQRTQDAMVAVAILGPCRAQVPHDIGQSQ